MWLRDPRSRRVQLGPAILVAAIWGAAGSPVPPPAMETARGASVRPPVVFVTGMTGVGLRDAATGKSVWGKGKNLIAPHDRGHGLARSLTASHAGPQLLPDGVILDLRLFGVIRKKINQQLLDLFVDNGYRFGDLEHPTPTDDFFLFSYDWRQDNVASAARLADQLEQLRRTRGQETLQVNLICQSNGAQLCRYFTKYGALVLEDAESGRARTPNTLTVEKLILVGCTGPPILDA